ncbi:MBG domain-containing protein [Segnochrobactrum spirostomi]|uniref:MBG domain-containing protein n=1 Tax=Segnochrobactrum spirostomi TaxID=2608987 RepID=UPI001AD825C6|nr:MBG domain-containing protein [Segnochrobactrum spirostomi]
MSVALVVGFAGPGFAQSLPTGGSVAAGAATIATPSGTSLVVTQTSRNAIINWRAFSVGQGATVAFQNGSGATLNRVTGNVPSRLDGTITATGSLFLVNPAGVTVGTTGRIATGGSFLASTLDVPDADFMKGGDLTFKGTSTASVVNYGEIGSLGGDVALIARKVENAGTIDAPNGTAALAAGYEVLVRDGDLDGGKFVVKVGGADTEAKTSGKIRAAAAELRANGGNVYALAGNTDGIVAATGTAKTGGRIFLTAGDTGRVDVSQKVVARSASSGGKAKGGAIRVSAKKVAVSGTLDAKGDTDAGGSIVVDGGDLTFAQAVIDVSGSTGGLIEIGHQVANASYRSETISADSSTVLRADSTGAGSGGAIRLSAAAVITTAGQITARGGPSAGNGGQIGLSSGTVNATSGGVLNISGTLDASSPTGQGGSIEISGRFVLPSGNMNADGVSGGAISIQSSGITQSGTITANGSSGPGGTVTLRVLASLIQTSTARTAANSGYASGGTVALIGASGANVFTSGVVTAVGGRGGTISALGNSVTLAAANFDASGTTLGGKVHIGGAMHGTGFNTSYTTVVNGATTLRADATASGNGGEIVVWSDSSTKFWGHASARGGAMGGNGGTVEVSSGNTLTYGGVVDASSLAGTPGTLLLDPKNITISAAAGGLAQYDLLDPNTGHGSGFGTQLVQMPGGTIIVTKPLDDVAGAVGAGSVFYYNSSTGALISALQGTNSGDNIGSGGLFFINYNNYQNYYVKGTTQIFVNDTTAPYLVLSPNWNGGAGAITWAGANSTVAGVVSASNSLVGSTAGDRIGDNFQIAILPNNNYVSISPTWGAGKGAVTMGSASTGIIGAVSSNNSIIGSASDRTDGSNLPGDRIGSNGITVLLNGNFVVRSPNWNQNAGAITFFSQTTSTVGVVSASNSFVGTNAGQFYHNTNFTNPYTNQPGSTYGYYGGDNFAAYDIVQLSQYYFVITSPNWSIGRGSVTIASSQSGITGTVSGSNSLIGTTGGTQYESIYGYNLYYGSDSVGSNVFALTNGNFVVTSPSWNSNRGAATFSSVTAPTLGAVSSSNSLIGSTAGTPGSTGQRLGGGNNGIFGGDQVGTSVTPLASGNYVVRSTEWDGSKGAVTFGSGMAGVVGAVSSTNSLVGSAAGDRVGGGGVTLLGNGDYVFTSPSWSSSKGAVTRGAATGGLIGFLDASNSIVGATSNDPATGLGGDSIGSGGIVVLSNGSWVISSPNWSAFRGAVTLMSATQATSGAITASNSLVGTTSGTLYKYDGIHYWQIGGDQIGSGGIITLSYNNGSNFLILSPYWGTNKGAVTFQDPNSFATGALSSSNSLVGANSGIVSYYTNNGVTYGYYNGGDSIGTGGSAQYNYNPATGEYYTNILVLENNNYAISSPSYALNKGAVTFGSATSGISGVVDNTNSYVGTTAGTSYNAGAGSGYTMIAYQGGDQLGYGGFQKLSNNNILIQSPMWNNTAGAVTWSNGVSPFHGTISSTNSLIGSSAGDRIGYNVATSSGASFVLANGNYLITSPGWNGGRGAVTFGAAGAAVTGVVSANNSLVGASTGNAIGSGGVTGLAGGGYIISSPNWPGATWSSGGALTGTVSVANTFTGAPAGGTSVVTPLNNSTTFAISASDIGSGAAAVVMTDPTSFNYSNLAASSVVISPLLITSALNSGTSIILEANNDITINDAILANQGSAATLTLKAGRSVFVNARIDTGNGNIAITANDTVAQGVVDGQRDTGAAAITVATGSAISAGTGTISLVLAAGLDKTHSAAGNISIASAITASWVLVENMGAQNGTVTLSSGGTITATVTGTSITIGTGGDFINNSGAAALTPGAGRWLIYSASSGGDVFGGLDSANTAVWNTAVGGSVAASGNRYVFAQAGVLKVQTTSTAKTYGDDATGQIQGNYVITGQPSVAGAYLGDTTHLYTGTPVISSAGATANASVQSGGYAISGAIGSLAVTALGYSSSPFFQNSGVLTVNARPITVTADPQSRSYGSANPTLTYVIGGSGLANNDSLTGSLATAATSTSNVGTYTITQGSLVASSNYTLSYVGTNLSVTARLLTVTATNATKTYDGLAFSGGNGVTYTGFVNGQTASILGGSLAYGGNAQGAINAGTYALTASGLISSNYAIAYAPGTLNVDKAALTVTAINATKTYDGQAFSGGNGVTYAGFVNGETAAVLGGSLAYGGNAQGAISAGTYALTASGLTSGNYTIGYAPGTLNVDKAALTVTAINATKTYDGLAFSGGNGLTYAGFVNGETAAVLGGSLAYGGSAQGAINAGTYALIASGLTSGNYAIGYTSGTLSVNKAALTVTANDATKAYDGLAFSGGNGLTYAGFVNGETAAVLGGSLAYGGNAQGAINAGTYALTASGLTSGNYTIAYTPGALIVNKASLTVTANNATKTYDGLAFSGGNGVTYTGFVNGETAAVLGGSVAYGGNAQGAINAGTYALTASGLTSGNYTIAYTPGTLNVNKTALTVTANDATKAYDGLAFSGGNGLTYAGFVNGETAAVLGGSLAYGGNAQGAINAGTYALTASGLTSGNYAIAYTPGALIVNKASLTVTANNATKTYDGLAFSGGNGVTYTGFVNGETAAVLGGSVAYGGNAQGAINAGTYALTASGLTSGNYTIAYTPGTLNVNKAALTVTATNAAKTYDGLAFSGGNGVTYAGFVNGETAAVLGGSLAYGGNAQGAVNAGAYALTASGLTSDNYTIGYTPGALIVNKASLTVTANDATKTYDGLAFSGGNGVTYTGFVNGETASVLGGSLTYAGNSQGAINAGTYAISASGLTSGNYTIAYTPSTLSVNKASLTVTANNATKTYDGLAFSGGNGLTYAGFVNGETASVLGGSLTYAGNSQGAINAGTYALTASGLTSGNYAIAYTAGTLNVDKASLTVTANNATKTYDGLAFSGGNGLTYAGFVNGETASVLGGSLTYAGNSQGAINAGTYALTASGLTSGNYAIAYTAGTLNVDKASLTVTANNATKTYDGLAFSGGNGVTYAGFVNGETAAALGGSLAYGGNSQGAVNAGAYALTTSGLTAGNYAITYSPGTLNVNKASLTVTANNATKTYDGQAFSGGNGVTYAGFVNDEDASVLSGGLAYGGNSQGAVNAGAYALTASGLTSDNYAIAYQAGAVTVAQRTITVAADAKAMTYGDGVPGLTWSVTSGNLVNGDTLSGALATAASPTANVGTYAVTQGTLAASANYALTYVDGVLNVTPRAITVAGNDAAMVAGTAVPALGWSVIHGSLVDGDALSGALATAATAGSPAGVYAILQGTLGASANYALTYVPGALTVTAAPVPPNTAGVPPVAVAAALAATPNRFVETSASNATVVFTTSTTSPLTVTGGESGGTATQASGGSASGGTTEASGSGCTGGATSSAACTATPHPENRRVGRFLTFSAATPRPSPTGNGAATVQ